MKKHKANIYDAIELAISYHRGQVDKSGQPYLFHLLRVGLEAQKSYTVNKNDAFCAGVLHDILEDTPCTVDELKSHGFNVNVIFAVATVTKDKAETYNEFINRIKKSDNLLAKKIKVADLNDNLSPNRMRSLPIKEAERLISKYTHALLSLSND